MADDGIDGLEEDGGVSASSKKNLVGGILPHILKWVAIGVGAVILIVIISVVTYNILSGSKTRGSSEYFNEDYHVTRDPLSWYKDLDPIRTRTSDDLPASVVISVYLGYDDDGASAEISKRTVEIYSNLRRYFALKTANELKNPANELSMQMELKNIINDEILQSSKIRSVEFHDVNVIEQ